MKPLAPVDFLGRAPRPWAGVLLATLAALLLAATGWSCWQLEQERRSESTRLAQRAARLLPPPPRKLTEAERVRQAQVEKVTDDLRAPWAELLAAFEDHGRADIGLLKLEPDARAGVVRVTGQARDAKSLFAYLLALESDPRLAEVALTTHQTERDTPGQPLRFTIQAGWRAAALRKEVS